MFGVSFGYISLKGKPVKLVIYPAKYGRCVRVRSVGGLGSHFVFTESFFNNSYICSKRLLSGKPVYIN